MNSQLIRSQSRHGRLVSTIRPLDHISFDQFQTTPDGLPILPHPGRAPRHPLRGRLLDLHPDSEVNHDILHSKSTSDEKNARFFWYTGYTHMFPSTQCNIRAWYRRFSKRCRTFRVLDRLPSSPLNVANFLDISDPGTSPVPLQMVPSAAATCTNTCPTLFNGRSCSSMAA